MKAHANKLVLLFILLVLGALISSCVTSPQVPEAEEMVPQTAGKGFTQTGRAIRIYPVTGAKVAPVSAWQVQVPVIDSDRFEQTLIATLRQSNMFSTVSTDTAGDYGLTAKIIGQQMTAGLANVMTLLVRYTLVETATGNVLWQQNVLSQNVESVSDVFLGTERMQLALQHGVQKNLALLLEKLNNVIALPAGEAVAPPVAAPGPELLAEPGQQEDAKIAEPAKQSVRIPGASTAKELSIAVVTSSGNLIDDHHFERVMSDQQLASYMADTVEQSLQGVLPVNTTYTKVVDRNRTRAIVYEGRHLEESKRVCTLYGADKVVATMFSRTGFVGSAEIHLYDCAKGRKKIELVSLNTHYGEKYYLERDFEKALSRFYEDNLELLQGIN